MPDKIFRLALILFGIGYPIWLLVDYVRYRRYLKLRLQCLEAEIELVESIQDYHAKRKAAPR
jgi:hypothetical protein